MLNLWAAISNVFLLFFQKSHIVQWFSAQNHCSEYVWNIDCDWLCNMAAKSSRIWNLDCHWLSRQKGMLFES
jgi:hypothetical protein